MRMPGWIAMVLLVAGCADAGPDLPVTTALSGDRVRHQQPSYSPDGSRIAYWSPADDKVGNQLWVANADLSDPRPVPVTTLFGFQPLWSPDGSLLAVASSDLGIGDVVTISTEDWTVRRITTAPGIEAPLAWYPDGDRLAYFATLEGSVRSFVISISSGQSVPLVGGESRPHVGGPSPDGSHIGYIVIEGSRSTIWIADSLGRNPRQLTTEGFESPSTNTLTWSPDGKEVLYLSRRTGTNDLWIAPIDGGAPRQLTRDVRNDYGESWSPDGRWVAFLSDRGRQTDVWIVPAAGGEERRVTDSAIEETAPLLWHPGQARLIYGENDVAAGVFALDLATSAERRLTPDSLRTLGFWVSPDGTQFFHRIDRGGNIHELVVAPIAGGAGRVVVPGGGNILNPRWSPDGSRVVYTSDRAGTNDLWIVDLAGGPPRRLLDWGDSQEFLPVFSRDGSAVIFTSERESTLSDLWRVPAAGGEATRLTRVGTAQAPETAPGSPDIFFQLFAQRDGQFAIARLRPDGTVQRIWDRTNVIGWSVAPSGDSLSALVEQPDGSRRTMILAANGGGGRMILSPGDIPGLWSQDGRTLTYSQFVNGAQDIGIVDVATGTKRRLTTTPENEGGSEITRDGKTVVFNRATVFQRLFQADLGKLTAGTPR